MNFHRALKRVIGVICIFVTFATQASGPLWTFTPDNNYPPSITLSPSQVSTIKYTVTNQLKNRSVQLAPTSIKGIKFSGCTDALAPMQSCTLILEVNGNTLPQSIIGGPVLCNRVNPMQCYKPGRLSELHITLNSQAQSSITISGGPLLLARNQVGSLRVTNTGAVPAVNIMASLPPTLATKITQDASQCAILAPGASCNLHFTANGAFSLPTTISVSGINSNVFNTNLSVGYNYFTDGEVDAIHYDNVNNKLYIGGDFNNAGMNLGGAVGIDVTTAAPVMGFPCEASVIIPDGNNGWYIGGTNCNLNGTMVKLAHAFSDGSLDLTWNPAPNDIVTKLVLDGGILYVGGQFTNIGGQNRNYLAAIDVTTGLATSWDPNPSGGGFGAPPTIYTIVVNSTTIYIGGDYSNIGGQARASLASFDKTTGLITAWNPNPSYGGLPVQVIDMTIDNGTIYTVGSFTSISGIGRGRIASFDEATGNLTAWNPNANNYLKTILIDGTTAYVGGRFTQINGQPRNRIAAINTVTGVETAWNPNANFDVSSLALGNGVIYVGGSFSAIGGQNRLHLAAIDLSSGLATSWDPSMNGAQSLQLVGNTLYCATGGYNYRALPNLIGIDLNTGMLSADWKPAPDGQILSIATGNGLVYAGGWFGVIGGQSRSGLGALDPVTGLATAWNPNPDSGLTSMIFNNNILYTGGYFTNIGGQARNFLAAFDSNGNLTPWDPNANDRVNALAIENNTLYAGGSFITIDGQAIGRLAAIDLDSGHVNPSWNPNANNEIYALDVSNGIVYAGGGFNNIGGQALNYLAAIDTVGTGTARAWNPNPDSYITSLKVIDNLVYAGGDFSFIGGQSRTNVAAIDIISALANSWAPLTDSIVYAIEKSDSNLFLGGGFNSFDGQSAQQGFYLIPLNHLP